MRGEDRLDEVRAYLERRRVTKAAVAMVTDYLAEGGREYEYDRKDRRFELESERGVPILLSFIWDPSGEGDELLHAFVPILSQVDPRNSAMGDLIKLNARVTFGKFSWYPEFREVWLEYLLLLRPLDDEKLDSSLRAVGAVADEWVELLHDHLGGEIPYELTGRRGTQREGGLLRSGRARRGATGVRDGRCSRVRRSTR